jgi:ABC-type multidrug transport system ATPase subunit
MAVSVIETLRGLARLGRTVVLSIHQPNSLITSQFDDFMLLAEGRAVYDGPWDDAITFFANNGYPCPHYTNPTDYFLSVLTDDGARERLTRAQESRVKKVGWEYSPPFLAGCVITHFLFLFLFIFSLAMPADATCSPAPQLFSTH